VAFFSRARRARSKIAVSNFSGLKKRHLKAGLFFFSNRRRRFQKLPVAVFHLLKKK